MSDHPKLARRHWAFYTIKRLRRQAASQRLPLSSPRVVSGLLGPFYQPILKTILSKKPIDTTRGKARGKGLTCRYRRPPPRGLTRRSPAARSSGDPTKSMCAEARYLMQWRPGQRLPYAAPRRGLEPKAGHNQALILETILGRILLYSFFGVGGGIMVLSGGLTGKAFH